MMYLYSAAKTNRSRLLYLGLFGSQAALLVMSSTRSAWAGFALAFPLFILCSKSRARLLIPVVAMIIIAACLSSVVYYGAYKELTEKKEYGFSSWHFRTAYAWPASIKAFKQKPVMGWGLGNDLYALTKAAKLKTPHTMTICWCWLKRASSEYFYIYGYSGRFYGGRDRVYVMPQMKDQVRSASPRWRYLWRSWSGRLENIFCKRPERPATSLPFSAWRTGRCWRLKRLPFPSPEMSGILIPHCPHYRIHHEYFVFK